MEKLLTQLKENKDGQHGDLKEMIMKCVQEGDLPPQLLNEIETYVVKRPA